MIDLIMNYCNLGKETLTKNWAQFEHNNESGYLQARGRLQGSVDGNY